jgi:hypothetical protein
MYALTMFICVILGVLNIILFFKIWGMTNDVKRIAHASDDWDVRKIILSGGDKDEIRKAVLNRIATVVIEKSKGGSVIHAENILKSYQKMLDKYEIKAPEVLEKIKTDLDVYDLFHPE